MTNLILPNNMKRRCSSLVVAILCITLVSCSPLNVATTAGGLVGVSFLEDRTTESIYEDRKIHLLIKSGFQNLQVEKDSEVFVMVYESEVMLVGFTARQDIYDKMDAVVRNTAGVQRFYNHVIIKPVDLLSYGHDRLLGFELSTRLSFEKGVHEVNYIIRVVDGIAYILGVAFNQEEVERVRVVVSSIKGMRGLVEEIKIKEPVNSVVKKSNIVQKPASKVLDSVDQSISTTTPLAPEAPEVEIKIVPLPTIN